MNGIIGEYDVNVQSAADHRHPPVINRVTFPSAGHDEVPVGEALFKGSKDDADGNATAGATPVSGADKIAFTDVQPTGGTATKFSFGLGEVVPGTVVVSTDDTTAQKISDNGDGTLGGTDEDGTGTIDYATGICAIEFTTAPAVGKTVTIKAVPAGYFLGIADSTADNEDEGVNVVIHGSVHEGIAKVNGVAATSAQLEFLSRHGIY